MKQICRITSIILLFITQTLNADENNSQSINDITRFQLRQSNFGNPGWSQSTFIQFPNKFYFLDLYEQQYNTAYQPWHLDVDVGQPIPGLGRNSQQDIFDWVVRGQKYCGVVPVLSAGLQWNFSNIPAFKKLFGKKTQSFIQIFPIKTNNALGSFDIVHYYSIPLYAKFTLRGYNQYIVRPNQSNLFYPWADIIYSVNKKFDVYERTSYLSSHDAVLGNQGFEYWLGLRINLSV